MDPLQSRDDASKQGVAKGRTRTGIPPDVLPTTHEFQDYSGANMKGQNSDWTDLHVPVPRPEDAGEGPSGRFRQERRIESETPEGQNASSYELNELPVPGNSNPVNQSRTPSIPHHQASFKVERGVESWHEAPPGFGAGTGKKLAERFRFEDSSSGSNESLGRIGRGLSPSGVDTALRATGFQTGRRTSVPDVDRAAGRYKGKAPVRKSSVPPDPSDPSIFITAGSSREVSSPEMGHLTSSNEMGRMTSHTDYTTDSSKVGGSLRHNRSPLGLSGNRGSYTQDEYDALLGEGNLAHDDRGDVAKRWENVPQTTVDAIRGIKDPDTGPMPLPTTASVLSSGNKAMVSGNNQRPNIYTESEYSVPDNAPASDVRNDDWEDELSPITSPRRIIPPTNINFDELESYKSTDVDTHRADNGSVSSENTRRGRELERLASQAPRVQSTVRKWREQIQLSDEERSLENQNPGHSGEREDDDAAKTEPTATGRPESPHHLATAQGKAVVPDLTQEEILMRRDWL